jgi:hypothetical protein
MEILKKIIWQDILRLSCAIWILLCSIAEPHTLNNTASTFSYGFCSEKFKSLKGPGGVFYLFILGKKSRDTVPLCIKTLLLRLTSPLKAM